MDTKVTKKALGSSQLTIESLETEIGDGIVWIMGVTTDAFGAAVEEEILVLRHIDSRASDMYLLSPETFYRKSLVIPNLKNANAPRGIVKITGPMLLTSIKNATAAKMNSSDNMHEPEVDIFELAAKKLNSAALKIVLRHYYHGDANKCRQITKMLRGESSETPDTLMHLIVSYWKEKHDAPPDFAAIINGHDDIHRKEPKYA